MVVLLDLDEDDFDSHRVHSKTALFNSSRPHQNEPKPAQKHDDANGDKDERPNPNINGFSAALACYPNADTAYKRIWTWRTRYSTYLGGLGTGIGEGNEGVKCGRGDRCLAAKDIEMEIDCAADGLSSLVWVDAFQGESTVEESWIDPGEKAGYLTQEMEGIGGVVKKKIKKRVKVGKTVREYEDEREKAEYLGREIRMENRSWCGWCDRVILGQGDRQNAIL
ncbi:hypothetical protein MMC18_000832 [Xylographa bjoerkii]|nr:hypothetical protein [Xylographa bjoerkii]